AATGSRPPLHPRGVMAGLDPAIHANTLGAERSAASAASCLSQWERSGTLPRAARLRRTGEGFGPWESCPGVTPAVSLTRNADAFRPRPLGEGRDNRALPCRWRVLRPATGG